MLAFIGRKWSLFRVVAWICITVFLFAGVLLPFDFGIKASINGFSSGMPILVATILEPAAGSEKNCLY